MVYKKPISLLIHLPLPLRNKTQPTHLFFPLLLPIVTLMKRKSPAHVLTDLCDAKKTKRELPSMQDIREKCLSTFPRRLNLTFHDWERKEYVY